MELRKGNRWNLLKIVAFFVQKKLFSFNNIKPDPLPADLELCIAEQIIFNILLRSGLFSKAILIRSDKGSILWVYTTGQLYTDGIFFPEQVVSYSQAEN